MRDLLVCLFVLLSSTLCVCVRCVGVRTVAHLSHRNGIDHAERMLKLTVDHFLKKKIKMRTKLAAATTKRRETSRCNNKCLLCLLQNFIISSRGGLLFSILIFHRDACFFVCH